MLRTDCQYHWLALLSLIAGQTPKIGQILITLDFRDDNDEKAGVTHHPSFPAHPPFCSHKGLPLRG